MSLEGGREGGEGRGGEGRGGEGRGGEGRGGEGRGGERRDGREGGRGGMTVIHIILMAPQYLYNNDVTYYVITEVNIRLGLRRTTMVRITSDVTWDSHPPTRTHR